MHYRYFTTEIRTRPVWSLLFKNTAMHTRHRYFHTREEAQPHLRPFLTFNLRDLPTVSSPSSLGSWIIINIFIKVKQIHFTSKLRRMLSKSAVFSHNHSCFAINIEGIVCCILTLGWTIEHQTKHCKTSDKKKKCQLLNLLQLVEIKYRGLWERNLSTDIFI